MFNRRSCEFVGSAASAASFVPSDLPEVAFLGGGLHPDCLIPLTGARSRCLGRSNVGKSSLINAVTGSGKAKVSEKPGYTRTVNFYRLGRYLSLVDLPG